MAEHKAQALIISCIDWRFQKMIGQDMAGRGFDGNADRISWPGASWDFENVNQAAKLSIQLHDPEEVLIYEHEDCGAYGMDNSEETHRANAQKLALELQSTKPEIKVTTLIAAFDGIKEL